MSVFTLCGDSDHALLLDHVLTKDNLTSTVAVVVVDLTRPWTVMAALKRWLDVLEDRVSRLGVGEVLDQRRLELFKAFQSYSEEAVDTKDKGDEEQILLDLDEGVFVNNLGIPLIVVANKVDAIGLLANNYDYRQEHLDFIQYHLRTLCLQYGAAVVYFGKDGKTKDALYRYLIHKGYQLPLSSKANVAELDSIFIPSGWDNVTKINVLKQGMQNLSATDPFDDIIRPPAQQEMAQAREVTAEDEQEFLSKQQPLLGKARAGEAGEPARRNTLTDKLMKATVPSTTPTPAPGVAESPALRSRTVSATARPASTAGVPKPSPAKAGTQNADVLANFFNSLLNKKPAAAGGKEDNAASTGN